MLQWQILRKLPNKEVHWSLFRTGCRIVVLSYGEENSYMGMFLLAAIVKKIVEKKQSLEGAKMKQAKILYKF